MVFNVTPKIDSKLKTLKHGDKKLFWHVCSMIVQGDEIQGSLSVQVFQYPNDHLLNKQPGMQDI